MLNDSFRVRYNKLPIAIWMNSESTAKDPVSFAPLHHHSEFELIGIRSGKARILIDQVPYVVSSGDIILIPPYSIHQGEILPNESLSHFCFCFDLSILGDDSFSSLLKNGALDIERIIHHSCSDSDIIYKTASLIFEQCEQHHKGWEFIVRGQLIYLIGLLEARNSVFSIYTENTHHNFSSQVLTLLASMYTDPNLTSRKIAEKMGYSQSYFCRIFAKNFSVSLQYYLRQYRLCKARLLLAQNTLSVSQTAVSVGFTNFSYFSKQFHDMFGCTPKEFQKLQIQMNNFS